ncbi:MAG: rod shape-determining protein MreD [Anaerolineae bacterium]|uniref:rod shape-determining protein MreD n=1 Tax=Promineifilum sp. TaxID=2664178 RepID=UPI001D86BE88|nr:rod shape-determining protein MreD [Anaerolineales bacterium]MCB8933837.1 rod shape-determining protein MreD [Promineifilum sp.]MCO5181410.1 rod shape-determining protein MreD [Promineifilum sp.]MCW5846310.1 rod shape-determining protein MreD [Anaerolineae bacterium]
MGNHVYVALPVMAMLAILQSSVLSRFPVLGVVPQLLFLVALVWGIARGIEEGLIWAFIAGLFADLFSIAPLGVSSLAFMAGVGGPLLLQRALPPRRLPVAMFMAMLGTLVYLAVYAVALRLFGFGASLSGLTELLPLLAVHAVLILPIYLLMDSMLRALRPRRVEF